MTEFKTQRRLHGSDDAWVPWYSLEWGISDQAAGGHVVVSCPRYCCGVFLTPFQCLVNDVDVSSSTALTQGADGKEFDLSKTRGDPSNKGLDYTFHITLNRTTVASNSTFLGTWEEGEKNLKYEWKGTFRGTRTLEASQPAETDVGPGGMTVTQLMAITSIKPTQKEIEVEGAQHYSFSDVPLVAAVLGFQGMLPSAAEEVLGRVEGRRMMEIMVGFVVAGLDRGLKSRSEAGFEKAFKEFPEVKDVA